MITAQEINGHASKLALAYERALTPLCKQTHLPPTAVAILLFFANNPQIATARDICALWGLKRAIVSAHVERLVCEGYLERRPCPGDRRKDMLVYTEKAQPVITAGRTAQTDFTDSVLYGLTEQDISKMEHCFRIMNANIDKLIKNRNV